MKKIQWKTLKMKLLAAETQAEKSITLEPGEKIVAAVAYAGDPGKIVDLGLYVNNNQVSAPMDISLWKKANAGNYVDGFKPIEIKGGSEVQARLSTGAALGAELEIEVVFGIFKTDTSC